LSKGKFSLNGTSARFFILFENMKKNLLSQAVRYAGMAIMILSFGGTIQSFAGGIGNVATAGVKAFRLPSSITVNDYVAGTIVIKVMPVYKSMINDVKITNSAVQKAFNDLQVSYFERKFPHADAPPADFNSWGAKYADLTAIYEIHYSATTGIEAAINKLIALDVFEYVEPRYIDHINFTPNDPNIGQQYFLTTIHAFQCFDTIKGDTNVVIGIVDSGTDTLHPDLMINIKINYSDPPDGIDNDGDGYIDNTKGWDVAQNDRTVQVVNEIHGVYTSGDADAVTNNATGVASPGFNCKFLPVKAALDASTGTIDNGYGGIQYAADHHCDVISCSWGGGGFSQAEQDVITYATINKNALVLCAAGNNGTNGAFYPAQYQYVMSVAATTSTDAKASFSNYGPWVTISAPGQSIYSTSINGTTHTYASVSGTSMATPITAGAAAMVKARSNQLGLNWNALQIKAQLMATADNIDAQNPGYIGQLGAGRVNMYRAVTEFNHEGVTMVNIKTTIIGDTLHIKGEIINTLIPTTNLNVTMSTTSPYVTILNNTVNAGAMGTMAVDSTFSPFTAKINAGTPINSPVIFLFSFSDGSYSSYPIPYTVTVNVDYLNITVNDISTSQTSHSTMAYNDPDLSTRSQGLGFNYRDSSMTYEIGFMACTDSNHVSDDIRTGGAVSTVDAGFATSSIIHQVIPSVADFESYGKFDDHTATAPLNILVTHHTMAWSSTCDRKYLIVEYYIKNTGTSAINNLYAGIFADWDIGLGGVPDKGNVDNTNRLGYVYENAGGRFYAGIKLLTTNAPFNHFAIDNDGTGGNGIWAGGPYASFTKGQKWLTLTTPRDSSGVGGTGDVSQTVSTGPLPSISPGDSAIVAFAVIAGDNLADLTSSGIEAQYKYANPSPSASNNTPVCSGSTINLSSFGGVTYSWNGPNSFTSTAQNPTISNSTTAASGTYTVTVTNANGCTATANTTVTINNCPSTLNLTLFLQGFYTGGGTMRNTLYNLGISSDSTATDTIKINLWAANHLSNSSPDYSAKTILHKNGMASVTFPVAVVGNSFYIAVNHRNSLETWSRAPVAFTGTNYNFSTSLTQAYSNGFNPPMKNMGPGVYAIWGGNATQDGTVDASDMAAVDNGATLFLYGYNSTDCNGDGATDASDMQLIDNNTQLDLFFARPY